MKILSYDRDSYRVRATKPKRTQDVARFVVEKQGTDKTYIVTFAKADGSSGQCSCPAGKVRKRCRHQKMLMEHAHKVAAKQTQQQTALPFPEGSERASNADVASEYQDCRKRYVELRRQREALAAKLAEIDREMKSVVARGKALKAKLPKAAA